MRAKLDESNPTKLPKPCARLAEAAASAIEQLAAAEGAEAFLQQAYATGVVYGILLDSASPDRFKLKAPPPLATAGR